MESNLRMKRGERIPVRYENITPTKEIQKKVLENQNKANKNIQF